jgi:HPt (histidine-containing phosphotransfer) domain-containing protein
MPTRGRREADLSEAHAPGSFDLSELRTLYGEDGLRTLLAVALDEFESQRIALGAALARRQWEPAAQALHRLTGTAAFFLRDEAMLEPLGYAERALRLADEFLAERAVARAEATLAALGEAFAQALTKPDDGRCRDGWPAP